MKALRIVFCILACLAVLAAIPLGIIFGIVYALIAVATACLFALIMFLAKRKSEPVVRKTDFMNSDEENEAIKREIDAHDEEK